MCNNLKKIIVTSFLCVFIVEKGICKKGILCSCKTQLKWCRETTFRSFFVFSKSFIWGKSTLVLIHFNSLRLQLLTKTNCIKLLIQRYSQFLLFEKGLGLVFSIHFVYRFSSKIFLLILLIDWMSLSDCLCFLNACQYVYCNYLFPSLCVIKSGWPLSSGFSPTWPKKVRSSFHHFKGLSAVRNYFRPQSLSLKDFISTLLKKMDIPNGLLLLTELLRGKFLWDKCCKGDPRKFLNQFFWISLFGYLILRQIIRNSRVNPGIIFLTTSSNNK